MKRFFLFSVSVLCLALAALIGFHVGSSTVEAQAPGFMEGFTAISGEEFFVILENGDLWRNNARNQGADFPTFDRLPFLVGNFWTGPPVSTESTTFGGIKNQYRQKEDD